MLEPFQLPFVQRGIVEVLVAGGRGRDARHVDRAARPGVLRARGRARPPSPGLVLADGLGFAAPLGAVGTGAARRGRRRPGCAASAARRSATTALTALVLVGALALGVILASDVFRSGSNVETLLFGSPAARSGGDIPLAAAASVLALGGDAGRSGPALARRAASTRTPRARSASALACARRCAARAHRAWRSSPRWRVGALLATALLVVPAATMRLLARPRAAVAGRDRRARRCVEGVAGCGSRSS